MNDQCPSPELPFVRALRHRHTSRPRATGTNAHLTRFQSQHDRPRTLGKKNPSLTPHHLKAHVDRKSALIRQASLSTLAGRKPGGRRILAPLARKPHRGTLDPQLQQRTALAYLVPCHSRFSTQRRLLSTSRNGALVEERRQEEMKAFPCLGPRMPLTLKAPALVGSALTKSNIQNRTQRWKREPITCIT